MENNNKMKLKDICEKGTSNIVQKDIIDRKGIYPIYGASGFIKNIDSFAMDKPYIGIVKDGAGVGRVMLLPAKSSIIGTMQYIIPKNGINASYLVYLLESMNLSKYSTGATIPHIYFKDYGNEQVKEHTKTEQQRIAKELDKVSELIDKSQTQLQKLDLLIKSKFVEIFGNYNLNCVNNNMQELYKLGNIVGGSTPDTNNLEYWNGTNLWITPAEIGDDDFIINDTCRKLTDKGVKSCSLKLLPKNTVLLSSRAPIGKVAIVGKEMYCNQGFKNIICGAKLNHIYLFYLLKYSNTYLNALGRGATFKEISKSVVENIKINVPDITLQNQFADFVDKVEQSKTKIKASLDKLITLKKALMQKYFG